MIGQQASLQITKKRLKHEQLVLQQQLIVLELIHDKLTLGFKVLLPLQKDIIVDKYNNELD